MASGTINNPYRKVITVYKTVSGVSIPANSSYTFDLSDVVPSGYWALAVQCRIDVITAPGETTPYQIPYVSGTGATMTWFNRITGTAAYLQNNTSAWNNATCYLAITCVAN